MQEADESQPSNRWLITLIIVSLAQALGTGGISLVYPFLPLYVQTLKDAQFISPELLAGLVIAAPPLVATIATPFWGRLADQYGRKKMVMRALFGASIILALMGFAETAVALIALRALQGLTSGIIAANMALVAGETPRERIGFALGTLQVGLYGGVAIGPIVGGILAERFGFQIPFFFTSAMLILAGLLVTLGVRETYVPAANRSLDLNPLRMIRSWKGILRKSGVKTVYSLRFLNGFAQRSIMPIAPLFVSCADPERVGFRRKHLCRTCSDRIIGRDDRRFIRPGLVERQMGLSQCLALRFADGDDLLYPAGICQRHRAIALAAGTRRIRGGRRLICAGGDAGEIHTSRG